MSADEDENEKVIHEKTDGGLTLLGEAKLDFLSFSEFRSKSHVDLLVMG